MSQLSSNARRDSAEKIQAIFDRFRDLAITIEKIASTSLKYLDIVQCNISTIWSLASTVRQHITYVLHTTDAVMN